jgi:DNA-binding transcriptional MerR regulator
MIHVPGGVPLYQPMDAQVYCNVSAQSINRWRREGWLKPAAAVGRGYVYTKQALDECLHTLGYDRRDTNVEVIQHG